MVVSWAVGCSDEPHAAIAATSAVDAHTMAMVFLVVINSVVPFLGRECPAHRPVCGWLRCRRYRRHRRPPGLGVGVVTGIQTRIGPGRRLPQVKYGMAARSTTGGATTSSAMSTVR